MVQKTKKIFRKVFLFVIIFLCIQNIQAIEESVFIDDYEIDYSYASAEEGDTFTLSVSIKNTDNIAKEDVFFELRNTDIFDIRSDNEWTIGSLEPGERKTNTFRIEIDKGVNKGKYDLEFIIEDYDDDWRDEFEIDVSSNEADFIIGNIKSSPEIIMPDEKGIKIEVTLENIGGGEAKFIRAKLELPEGIKSTGSYSDITNLGIIGPSENKVAVFFIDTEKTLSSGNNKAEIVLEYETDNDKKTERLDFNIPVKGKPLFRVVSSSTNPGEIYPGTEENQLSIIIENIGQETGEEASIRIFENSDQPFEFKEKTNYIGNIKEDESGTASFEFDVNSDALVKDYIVKIQIRSVSRDSVIVSEEIIKINLLEKESSLNTSFIVIASLVIGIIILVVLLVFLIKRV